MVLTVDNYINIKIDYINKYFSYNNIQTII